MEKSLLPLIDVIMSFLIIMMIILMSAITANNTIKEAKDSGEKPGSISIKILENNMFTLEGCSIKNVQCSRNENFSSTDLVKKLNELCAQKIPPMILLKISGNSTINKFDKAKNIVDQPSVICPIYKVTTK